MPIKKVCVTCGDPFLVPPSRDFRRCCSRECQARDKRVRAGTLEERLWSKVDRRGPDECWEWMASKSKGYGHIGWHGKMLKAHRLVYQWSTGDDPQGMKVRHSCDNPSCVNPKHLLIGTNQDNMDDKVKRGRSLKGEAHPGARLTEGQVLRIRELAGSMTQESIASMFGVSQVHVSSIVRRRAWSHI